MFKAFNKGELKYYNHFHHNKNYGEEAKRLPLKGKTILEIGSGTGLMTEELVKLGYEVTTVDPNNVSDYDYFQQVPDISKYDNVLALYDVGNYLGPTEWRHLKYEAQKTNFLYEIWPDGPVKFLTHMKLGTCHRIRLGVKHAQRAHLLFIYWGKGIVINHHKLYLHEN